MNPCILNIPPEVILHVCMSIHPSWNASYWLIWLAVSYLDLPDLASLVQASPGLAGLASDPALHRNRVRVIAPSRVQHSLFGMGSHGLALRPTIGDLINRDVIRGLNIERRWRMGVYFYSRSVRTVQFHSRQAVLISRFLFRSLSYNMRMDCGSHVGTQVTWSRSNWGGVPRAPNSSTPFTFLRCFRMSSPLHSLSRGSFFLWFTGWNGPFNAIAFRKWWEPASFIATQGQMEPSVLVNGASWKDATL